VKKAATSKLLATIINWAENVAIKRSYYQKRLPPWLAFKFALCNKLVYSKIKHTLGGKVQYLVAGGAPLNQHLERFFAGIGATKTQGFYMMQGYGLTETTGPATVTRPGKTLIGSVGTPIPGVKVHISHKGEILLKGISVSRKTIEDNALTRLKVFGQSFMDSWYHTGDLGYLDDDGNLFITGRSKEIIMTSRGINIAPSNWETRLTEHELISNAFLHAKPSGEGDLIGLIILEPDVKIDDELKKQILAQVKIANSHIEEPVRKFIVLNDVWNEDNKLLTPSMKVRRNKVEEKYQDILYQIHSNTHPDIIYVSK